mgnify:CR=1 FL=1
MINKNGIKPLVMITERFRELISEIRNDNKNALFTNISYDQVIEMIKREHKIKEPITEEIVITHFNNKPI